MLPKKSMYINRIRPSPPAFLPKRHNLLLSVSFVVLHTLYKGELRAVCVRPYVNATCFYVRGLHLNTLIV